MSTPTIKTDELVILIPNTLIGEEGDELTDGLIQIVRSMSQLGYWPVDFGEACSSYTEVWFSNENPQTAKRMAEHFIKVGGAV